MLRDKRKLPEEQDFRQWRQQLYEAYRAVEPKEHMWHLPDGRALRVVTTPNSEGGVTYLYDDVTERLDMHRRYDALIKVQSETLDHLAEAVAVFGSDGRVWLHNPAFQRMWKLSHEALEQHPHVDPSLRGARLNMTTIRYGEICVPRSPRSTTVSRLARASNGATELSSTSLPCHYPTGQRWSRSRT